MMAWIESWLEKCRGDGAQLPPAPALRVVIVAWLGAFVAIATIAELSNFLTFAFLFAPLGASCLLVFGFPDGQFSQPRNVIFGHLSSSLIGLIFLNLCGVHWWSVAIAASTAIATMMICRIAHPPAASNPVLVFLTQPSWSFLLFPTLAGVIVLVGVALVYNNATRAEKYPKYW